MKKKNRFEIIVIVWADELSWVFYQDLRIELIWGGGCIRETFNPTFSELCIIAFHYDDPLSLADLLPLLLPLLSPCVWY
jgi:hypothetical protein